MSNKSTSILPRVLFLVTLFAVVSVLAYLWLQGEKNVLPKVQQTIVSRFPGLPGLFRRESPVSQITVELKTAPTSPTEKPQESSRPLGVPGSSPSINTINQVTQVNQTNQVTQVNPTVIQTTSPGFAQITSGTNIFARMIVGGESALAYLGGETSAGTVNANRLQNRDWSNPLVIGSSTPNTAIFTDVTAQNKLLAEGPVTMEQFTDGFLKVNGVGEVSASRVNLNSSSDVSDTLPTGSGGTGQDFSAVVKGAILTFANVGQMTSINPGISGYVLTSNGSGTVPSWEALPAGVSTTFANLPGGTNTSSAFVVGTGSSLGYTGSGIVDASRLLGADLSSAALGSLISFASTGNPTTINPGTAGYVLSSNGVGALPTWEPAAPLVTTFDAIGSGTNTSATMVVGSGASLGVTGTGTIDSSTLLGQTWAAPGTIGSTTPNTGDFTQLTAAGTSFPLQVGTGYPVKIDDNGRMTITYNGDSGSLNSSGGALFFDNTNNIGTGIGIYSNAGATAQGNMINVKVDNPNYAQAAFYMNYDGSSNAVEITSNSTDTSSNALAVTGNNINDSTVGIIGYELGRGTIKVTHNRPGVGNDQNASGLSIDLKGSGTRAQGVYVDSTETGGTLGDLLRLRNESIDKFTVDYQGNTTVAGNIIQGANGTNTTFTKQGNTAGDQFFVGTNGAFRVQRSAGNSEAFRTQVNGDSQGRWLGTSDGQLKWGPGNATQDVILRRGLANTLFLDGGIFINNLNQNVDTVVKGQLDSNLLYINSATDRIGIGTSGPAGSLHINRNQGTLPTLLVNQLGTGDIITASSSGATKFTVSNAGDGNFSGALSVGSTTTLGGKTYTWPGTIGGNGYTLTANTSGALSWTDPTTLGTNYWQQNSGVLAPLTLTNSVALGKTTALAGSALDIGKDSGTNALALFNQTGSADILTASTSGTTKFVINNAGNVGVGQSTPSYRLDVSSTGATNPARFTRTDTGPNYVLIEQANNANNSDQVGLQFSQGASPAYITWGGSTDSMQFFVAGASTPGMTLLPDGSASGTGRLGIGNTGPSSLLTVGTTAPFLVDSSGNVTQGVNGANTTFTKRGNTVGDEFFIGTNGAFRAQRSASGSEAFRTQVNGDTQGRLLGTSDGQLKWGAGNAVQDVILRRGATNTLFLDGGIFMNNLNQTVDTVIKGSLDSNLLYVNSTTDRIGIGTSGPNAALQINKNMGTLPSFAINHSGTGDLMTASASGNTKFVITNGGNVGIGGTAFGTSAANTLAITNSTAPSTAITNGVQLFAVDVAGSHELRVMDEAGNVTTLSPHNFSLIPDGRSEDLAWSFYSERNGVAINADMTKALRIVEDISGEKLIYLKNLKTGEDLPSGPTGISLEAQVSQTQATLEAIQPHLSLTDTVWSFLKEVLFTAKAVFKGVVEFWADVRFKAGVVFEQAITFQGRLRVNADTAGTVVIPAGATKVRVQFQRSFASVPLITLSAPQYVTAKYELGEVTTNAFVIQLTQESSQPITLQWWAVETSATQPAAVEVLEGSATSSSSAPSSSPVPQVSSTPQASPQVSSPQPTPSVDPSPAAASPSPSLQPSPSPTVSPSPTLVTSPDPSVTPSASPADSPVPSPSPVP